MATETITLEGHIIDSQHLARVLDDIIAFGADFRIVEVHVGGLRSERSHATVELHLADTARMPALLEIVGRHGAIWRTETDATLVTADADGVLPDGFYATTNQTTLVRREGQWCEVRRPQMDCGLVFDAAADEFRCVPIHAVRLGDLVVCGDRGVRVRPFERQRALGAFQFAGPEVSAERPRSRVVRGCALQMREVRKRGRKLLLVVGPAIVYAGAVGYVVRLIERGYVNVLFAGNGLASYDIELALYGTCLGVHVDKPQLSESGYTHHLRAINAIRRAGGIRPAVERGLLNGGILHACVKWGVEWVLAGSIRDDGPLPDVITDSLEAQAKMRAATEDVGFALLAATGLHATATVNLLPAATPLVCVDIAPTVLARVRDRSPFQTVAIASDVEPFLRALVTELEGLE